MPVFRSALAAVAAGGVLGAEARYGLGLALPAQAGRFPWSTLLVNLTGSLLIGVLMAWLGRQAGPHPLLRLFLGVGILGGYTTYSAFAVDIQRLLLAHRPLTALGYLAATVLGCAAAVWLATAVSSAVGGRPAPDRHRPAEGEPARYRAESGGVAEQ
jgi:fluoride exporter